MSAPSVVASRPMRALLLDPFGGLAGDMLLGALLDLGAPADLIDTQLESLGLPGWQLALGPTERRGIGCTRAVFRIPEEDDHRHLPEILDRIAASGLPTRAKERAAATFRRLAEAEARIHRVGIDEVHFHEVGAADAILDICGVSAALVALGVDELLTLPLPAGTGTVACAHGELPVPAPATLELLAGFPILAGVGRGEMVTPTGAALLATWGRPLPDGFAYRPGRVGYGAGARETSLTRVVEVEPLAPAADHDRVWVLETHLDDVPAEELAYLMERLFALGALDVAYAPLVMKKGRPGVALTCLVRPEAREAAIRAIFAETPTLGLREQLVDRRVLPRTLETLETPLGPVRFKVSGTSASPEYEDCAAIARARDLPLRTVLGEVSDAWKRARRP